MSMKYLGICIYENLPQNTSNGSQGQCYEVKPSGDVDFAIGQLLNDRRTQVGFIRFLKEHGSLLVSEFSFERGREDVFDSVARSSLSSSNYTYSSIIILFRIDQSELSGVFVFQSRFMCFGFNRITGYL